MVVVGGGGFKGTGGFSTSGGFTVQFERSSPDPLEQMREVGVAVVGASVEAVSKTTEEIKNRVRDYIDAHFTGSQFTRNSRRRAANSIQSHYYDDLAGKGQYTGLIYSKLGRGSGPASFVDYLLLHMFGGDVVPQRGNWLRIANPAIGGTAGDAARTGSFPQVDANVFFVASPDGQKLYLLRRYGANARGSVNRATQLIATLVKQVAIPASLSGLTEVLHSAGMLLEGALGTALDARGVK